MYLVFDIGGTNTRLAASSDGKTLGDVKSISTPKDFDQGITIIKKTADELTGGEKIESVAGGVAGPLDKNKTMLVSSPHIGGWVNKPFKKELEKVFNAKVYLENDASLAALGEAIFGAGQGKKIVAYLTISTGVGGGRVVNGKIDDKALGFEPGHQIIIPDGNPCNCGGKGHLEAYIGGAYRKGDFSLENWDEIAKYLAIGLNNVAVFWSPDIIVLGGSVMQSIKLDKLKAYLKEVLTIFPNQPEITLSKLGYSAGLYGAMEYLHQNIT